MLHALLTLPTPRATPAQLADEFRITRAAVTARIDRLVDRELVTREPDWVDRRRTWVRPTAAGREMWVRHLRAGTLLENEVFGVLDDAELAQLNALLRKVLAPLDP